MPYEIESVQQRKLTEQGSRVVYRNPDHVGDVVYVAQGHRDELARRFIWRQVYDITGNYIASYVADAGNFNPETP